jgi:hypothetical protein
LRINYATVVKRISDVGSGSFIGLSGEMDVEVSKKKKAAGWGYSKVGCYGSGAC